MKGRKREEKWEHYHSHTSRELTQNLDNFNTQNKALNNRVKRSGNEKEERVVPHTESKRVRLEEEVKPIQAKEVSTEKKEQSTRSEEKKDSELLFQEVKEITKSSRLSASSSDIKVATRYGKKNLNLPDFRDYSLVDRK